jgi:hypothetical protein
VKAVIAAAVALLAVGVAAAANPHAPKKVIIPAVQAKVKAINIKLSDLPAAGWQVKPPQADTGTPRCSYYNPDQSDLTENGDANSPQFTLASSSFVSSNTSIFKTAAQGRTAYARVVQPKLPKCLGELFRKGSGQPQSVTIVFAAERKFPKLAERSNAYRIAADFKNGSGKIHVFLDVVVMNRAKVDAVLFFAGIGSAFKDSFEQSVAAKVAARTKNA